MEGGFEEELEEGAEEGAEEGVGEDEAFEEADENQHDEGFVGRGAMIPTTNQDDEGR